MEHDEDLIKKYIKKELFGEYRQLLMKAYRVQWKHKTMRQ